MEQAPSMASKSIDRFCRRLHSESFTGDIETGLGAREVAATDNSIYYLRPLAIVYPREAADINRIVRAAADPQDIVPLSARGGNTGTNGQSLSRGVVVDFARYMNRIIAIDADESGGTVTVEPGVVLDQLNAALATQGLFFPPMVSTASRATIGGMVATDASGKGSRRYGKTSDYIQRLDIVLADGSDWSVVAMDRDAAEELGRRDDVIGLIHREALRIACEHEEEIARVFPDMNRGLTGYNLQRLHDRETGRFTLAPLLAGSEGTLAISKAITLRVIPKPAHTALTVLRYDSFNFALRDVDRLTQADPTAIEIIDDNVLGVARSDIVWDRIKTVLGDDPEGLTRAISFVEFTGTAEEVDGGLARLEALARSAPAALIDTCIVRDRQTISSLWSLREKSVGLLAKLGGGRQGMPFVEDTAVPPARLADYVEQFRAVLDRYGLKYGMFGHADVGCLHVRPFLDMKNPAQAALIRPISDEVASLTKAHGGLLWGEHGRGFRGEYSPFFFGPTLYAELVNLKRAFDPANLFNPGKLASPSGEAGLDRIDEVPFRGTADNLISGALREEYDRAIACNGNGACFSWDARDAMCPSYKATRDRAQSPKGRAALLRTWARLQSAQTETPEAADLETIEAAAAASLSTCLSCKACTTLCPVSVDIPSMKSRFFQHYWSRRSRPARHRLLGLLEPLLALGRKFPALANALVGSRAATASLSRVFGLVDLPRFAPTPRSCLPPAADLQSLRALSPEEASDVVVLMEDTFTAGFDGTVIAAATDVLEGLGYRVFRLPARPNGKALHVAGRRRAFSRIAEKQVADIRALASTGVRLAGVDQAISLMYEQEYREFGNCNVRVAGLDEVIAARMPQVVPPASQGPVFRLFTHCTEGALRPEAAARWQTVFRHFGMELAAVHSGCCGMAGMFGHEAEHQDISTRLFELSWRPALGEDSHAVLATGFSCRCQVKRLAQFRPRHPVEALRPRLLQQQENMMR